MKPKTFEIQILDRGRWTTIACVEKRRDANKARRRARFFYPAVRVSQPAA